MESAGPSPGGIGARAGAAVVGLRRSAFAAVASSPPVTRGLACALCFCFFLQLLLGDAFRKQFALVPAKVIPKLWMLLTAAIVELNPLTLLVNLAVLFFAGGALEPLWGWKELVKFLCMINLAGFFLLTATYVVAFVALRNVLVLYSQFGGFTVSAAGLLLGLKQAAPEEEVRPNPQSQGLRYKYLPLVFLAFSLVLTGVLEEGSPFFMALYGTLASWFYIRRFQRRPDASALGDQSESMRLVTLLPEAVQPTIETMAKSVSFLARAHHLHSQS